MNNLNNDHKGNLNVINLNNKPMSHAESHIQKYSSGLHQDGNAISSNYEEYRNNIFKNSLPRQVPSSNIQKDMGMDKYQQEYAQHKNRSPHNMKSSLLEQN